VKLKREIDILIILIRLKPGRGMVPDGQNVGIWAMMDGN